MSVAAIGASVAGAAVSGLMAKKGSKDSGSQASTNQTQTNLPWAELQPYLLDLYSQAGNLFNQGVPRYADSAPYAQYYPWQTTTAYDPSQTYLQGLNAATNYATNYLPQLTDAGMSGIGQLMGAADVANNPYVQAVNQQTAQTIGDTGMQGIAEYARQMGNAGQDYSLRSAQATGDYGRMLGNANQNFGMAANQAANRFGMEAGQAVDRFGLTGAQTAGNLGRVLGNAVQDFGLASGQAMGQFGRQSRQATADMGAMFGDTLGDWRDAYNVTRQNMTDTLQRDWLPGVRSGAGLAGQYGSTRQGIAEGVAMGDAMRHLTDYGRNFDTQFEQGFTGAGRNLRDTISNLGASAADLTSNLGRDYSQAYDSGAQATSNLLSNLGMSTSNLIGDLGMSTSNLVSNLGRDVSQGQQAAAAGLGNLIGQQGNNLAQMYMAQSLGLGNSLTGLSNSLGTALTNTNLGAYGQGVNAMQNAVSMMPEVAELGMAAPNVLQGVGAAEDALRQKVIDADKARWDYEQNAGLNQFTDAEQRAMQNYTNQWLPMQQFNSILSGSPYGTQTTTGNATQTAPSNWANAALGGAAIGNSLYQQFSDPYNTGTTGNAWGFTGNPGSSSYPVQSGDFFVNLF